MAQRTVQFRWVTRSDYRGSPYILWTHKPHQDSMGYWQGRADTLRQTLTDAVVRALGLRVAQGSAQKVRLVLEK